ncbi:MAG: GTPase ObgE [Verrucomicrobiota bacterium]
MKEALFVDHIKIYARAGRGGNGSAHFRRAKFVPKGGPDGGDGGNGGDVVLEVAENTDNLRQFFYNPNLLAEDGKGGAMQQKSGRRGKPAVAKVPPGTVVYLATEDDSRLKHPGRTLTQIADLVVPGEKFVLAQGGKGGRGNVHFKSSTNQTPTEAEDGEPGEENYFYLELRRIADAGLVGFPNAGKSSLLSAISAARPKVAMYPFTTLQPMIGVVEFDGFSRATVADIPGLIEGASRNVGLGHDFLRHILRCELLIVVVDAAGSEARDPVEDIEKLRKEIGLFDEGLAKRDWLIVANKMDLPEAKVNAENIARRFDRIEVIPVSVESGEGMEVLLEQLGKRIGKRPG